MWEFEVKSERIAEFEQIYGPGGRWADLFKNGNGYLGTELFHDPKDIHRYLTIDRWLSSEDHELFLSHWKKEYESLDAQCGGLIEQELLLGQWESIDHETR
jgi:heme-degrading monooxygenase HmoA